MRLILYQVFGWNLFSQALTEEFKQKVFSFTKNEEKLKIYKSFFCFFTGSINKQHLFYSIKIPYLISKKKVLWCQYFDNKFNV